MDYASNTKKQQNIDDARNQPFGNGGLKNAALQFLSSNTQSETKVLQKAAGGNCNSSSGLYFGGGLSIQTTSGKEEGINKDAQSPSQSPPQGGYVRPGALHIGTSAIAASAANILDMNNQSGPLCAPRIYVNGDPNQNAKGTILNIRKPTLNFNFIDVGNPQRNEEHQQHLEQKSDSIPNHDGIEHQQSFGENQNETRPGKLSLKDQADNSLSGIFGSTALQRSPQASSIGSLQKSRVHISLKSDQRHVFKSTTSIGGTNSYPISEVTGAETQNALKPIQSKKVFHENNILSSPQFERSKLQKHAESTQSTIINIKPINLEKVQQVAERLQNQQSGLGYMPPNRKSVNMEVVSSSPPLPQLGTLQTQTESTLSPPIYKDQTSAIASRNLFNFERAAKPAAAPVQDRMTYANQELDNFLKEEFLMLGNETNKFSFGPSKTPV